LIKIVEITQNNKHRSEDTHTMLNAVPLNDIEIEICCVLNSAEIERLFKFSVETSKKNLKILDNVER